MSATRLLVLGAVRIFQPVHGYDVRRELVSWRLEEWMNIQPGSIYSALKTLEKDGFIVVAERSRPTGSPARTAYRLTPDGEKEFQNLLRASWWKVEHAAEPLIPAMCLMLFMSRPELIAALQSRAARLEGQLEELRFTRSTIRDGATGAEGGTPEHVREILDFTSSRLKGELDWTRGFVRRLRDGDYVFADEPAPTD